MFKSGEIIIAGGRLIKVRKVRDTYKDMLARRTLENKRVKRARYLVTGVTPNGEFHSYYPVAVGYRRPWFGKLRFAIARIFG